MLSDLYPGFDVIDPMLISKTPDLSTVKNKDYLGQIKKDGYYYALYKENGEVRLFSRSKSKKTGFFSEKIDNVPHIKAWAEENLPNGTILIGEIYYPGGKSSDVTKIMGALPDKAAVRQQGDYGYISYWLHDILKYGGKSYMELPFERRFSNLCEHIDLDTPLIPQIEVAGVADGIYCLIDETSESYLEQGEEGMVWKLKSGLYLPGKRPKDNFKIKQETTFDAVIMGFVEPEIQYSGTEIETWQYWKETFVPGRVAPLRTPVTKAYYNGWKVGFEVGAYDGDGKLVSIGTITSGMTDELRADAAAHPEKYLGQVLEIQCMSVDKKEHSIRHGRLMRLRDDKNAAECTMESVFE